MPRSASSRLNACSNFADLASSIPAFGRGAGARRLLVDEPFDQLKMTVEIASFVGKYEDDVSQLVTGPIGQVERRLARVCAARSRKARACKTM